MIVNIKVLFLLMLTAATTASMAQTAGRFTDVANKSGDARSTEGKLSLAAEIEELRQKIESQQSQINLQQSQINSLKQQLSDRDVALQQTHPDSNQRQNTETVASLQGAVSEIRTSQSSLEQQTQTTLGPQATGEGPEAICYKGVRIVPGGFLAGESIWRQRAMNADIYTNLTRHLI